MILYLAITGHFIWRMRRQSTNAETDVYYIDAETDVYYIDGQHMETSIGSMV